MVGKFLAAALLLLGALGPAHAQTFPSSGGGWYQEVNLAAGVWGTARAACDAQIASTNVGLANSVGRRLEYLSMVAQNSVREECRANEYTISTNALFEGNKLVGVMLYTADWQSCPANSYLTNGISTSPTTCSCNAGFVVNGTNNGCTSSACSGGTVAQGPGYFDYGTASTGRPVLLGCSSGCEVVFDGSSPAGSATINGTLHYYARGTYYRTGESCTSGANPGTATAEIPPNSQQECAPGQGRAEMNGRVICVDQTTGEQTPASTPAQNTATQSTTNPDGSTTTTTTTVYPDGSRSTTTTTTAAGGGSSTSSTTIEGGAGSQAANGGRPPVSGPEPGDGEEDPCADNPNASGCAGTPGPVGEAREEGERSVADALGDFRDGMTGTPLFSAVGGFFTINPTGSCPTWTMNLAPVIDGNVELEFFCSTWAAAMLLAARVILILVASWYAVRIMLEN